MNANEAAGNRPSSAVTVERTTRTETHGHSELNGLTTVDFGDGGTQAYSFDDMGNRLTKNDSVSGNEAYTYNAANMLLTRGTNNYSNAPDGNTLTGGGRTSAWDSQNRLVTCAYNSNTSSYVYGSDGFRHQSTMNGATTDFTLDGQFFVRELRGGTAYATYLTGPTGPLYRRDATGATLRWYIFDGLGSVLGEVDASGSLDATRTYDVYGIARPVTGTPTSKHGWVGQLGHTSEDETGLVYMRARYMDPVTGRFLSEDPARSGANWFVYASNNPPNAVDASGKFWWLVAGVLLAALIGGFMSCVLSGSWSFSTFAKGAGEALLIALTAFLPETLPLVIPIAAAIGAAVGGIFGYASGGAKGAFWGALFGAVGGGLGGALGIEEEVAVMAFVCNAVVGLLCADGEGYGNRFGSE